VPGGVKLLRNDVDVKNIDLRVSQRGDNVGVREILIHFVHSLVVGDDPEVQVFGIARVLRDTSHTGRHRIQSVAEQTDVDFLSVIIRTYALNAIGTAGLCALITILSVRGALVSPFYLVAVAIVTVELLGRNRNEKRKENFHGTRMWMKNCEEFKIDVRDWWEGFTTREKWERK
jgi:hypothetical protein